MTIRFLADENFDHRIVTGLQRRAPGLNIITVLKVGLRTHRHVRGFHAGACHRLRVDSYRVMYSIDGQVITIDRVDRVT